MTTQASPPTIGFVSTYPPTSCGLATFTYALRNAVAQNRGTAQGLGVVRLVDSPSTDSPPEVTYSLVNGDRVSLRAAVETLNTFDVALMQHEYGIFGGLDGAEVLDLLKSLEVPSIVTLHTVLSRPSPSQKSILEAIVGLASQTVVMSETAGQRLIDLYEVDPSKITIIPHGARIALGGPSLADGDRPVFLTWGLIGPGKGLETAIEAFGSLKDIQPLPRYVILGTTHPKVQAASGDTYLNGLVARVQELGLEDIVEFDGRYLDIDELTLAVRRADVVVLPYESTEQVTSGVLVEAIGAGKPIIATAFPHAVELLSGGAGIVVPHSDAAALSAAARSMLENPTATTRMAGRARLMGSTLYWPVVARSYDAMATTLASELQRPGLRDSLARVG